MKMLLHSGTLLETYDINPWGITLRDVAWGLSRQLRFAGHCEEEYTVAQHSVLMWQHAVEREVELPAAWLLHDFAEAFMTDIPTPWKHRWPGALADEGEVLSALETRFDMPDGSLMHLSSSVKKDDTMCMRYEASHLFPNTPAEVWGDGTVEFTPMSPWKVWNKDRAMAELLLACSEAGIR